MFKKVLYEYFKIVKAFQKYNMENGSIRSFSGTYILVKYNLNLVFIFIYKLYFENILNSLAVWVHDGGTLQEMISIILFARPHCRGRRHCSSTFMDG